MKVLIGYDGSPSSDKAIDDLPFAGLPFNAEFLVLTAADVFAPAPNTPLDEPPSAEVVNQAVEHLRAMAEKALQEAERIAGRGAARVRELFPDHTVTAQSVADAPHWALIAKATHWEADLLVVGSHGHSALARVVLGSVSLQLLQHSPCSVRIVHAFAEPRRTDRPPRLLLGIDGSPDSMLALDTVKSRHWPDHTSVLVVAALDTHAVLSTLQFGEPCETGSTEIRDLSSQLRSGVRNACEELRGAGLLANRTVLPGDPKHLLLQEARRIGADAIFVGARGYSRMERLLVGSVSTSLALRAHCAVEVVRRAPRG